ncbi:MAG: Shikimate kinase [Phycisphaerae bacterium]|nr:Shikimate kinase [Phycisphaerae bacterium]
MNLVLIGYRGCGKTTVGELLAESMWMKFVDVDRRIAELSKLPPAEVFLKLGDGEFGQIESLVLESVCAGDGQVISVGGRALMRPGNVEKLKAGGRGKLIWLKVEAEALVRRLAQRGQHSPNYADTLEEVTRLLAEREPMYKAAADITLDATWLTPERTVEQLARLI